MKMYTLNFNGKQFEVSPRGEKLVVTPIKCGFFTSGVYDTMLEVVSAILMVV